MFSKSVKKVLAIVLAAAILPSSAFAATAENQSIPSYLSDSVTYAEAEALSGALGLIFSEKNGAVLFTENTEDPVALSLSCETPLTATVMCFEGEIGKLELKKTYTEALSSPVTMHDGRIYVPFRYVAEFFKARVYYENGEARAERTKYYSPVLMRVNGRVRERVDMPEGFESAVIAGDSLLYIVGDKLYKRSLTSDEEDKYLFGAGRAHVSGDRVFVFAGGEVSSVDINTGRAALLCKDVTMVGYTADDYAWCEMQDKSVVYDKYGNFITSVTGDFYNAFDYADGYVYYTDKSAALLRAKPNGKGSELLAKAAYYPEYIKGYIYYIDSAGNYRRVSADGKDDIMVYGLNLEIVAEKDGKHIYNYFSADGKHRLFISNPDGTDMKPYSEEGMASLTKPMEYKDGWAIVSYVYSKPYYVTESGAQKLSDDEPDTIAGVHGEWFYYVLK